jgi:hypothetical protein
MRMLTLSSLLALPALALPAFAQVAGQPFSVLPAVPQAIEALPEFVRPDVAGGKASIAQIDWTALQAELDAAPLEADAPNVQQQPVIALPMPDGTLQHFRIAESPIMEPALAAQLPDVRTYRVMGIDDTAAIGRIDVSQFGFRAMLRTSNGAMFIDPYSAGEREHVGVYYLRDYEPRAETWFCHVGPEHGHGDAPAPDPEGLGDFGERVPITIREYQLAMACTGEYGAFQSEILGNAPNAADAMAAIITVTNRTNVTFEADLGVRFVLVANNMLLAFFDPATDPYPAPSPTCTADPAANCSGAYLDVNQDIINAAIGFANYDVGHLLTRVRGGVASLSSVCGGNKANGISGIPRGGEADPLSALVVMHELGHQFGAQHTFNGIQGRCQGNINTNTSWEPGGGSTILAYPGACPVGGGLTGDNLVIYADPYFNAGSIAEMKGFLSTPNANCSTPVATQNEPPVVTSIVIGPSPIPPSTPFTLAATVTDDSPNLSYNWEQFDAGQPRALGAPDPGTGPLFRSWMPSSSPTRTFPRWDSLISGIPIRGEQLPTFPNAQRRFRFSVRDNQGASVLAPVASVVVRGTQAFAITLPEPGRIFRNAPVTLAWNVAATNVSPFNLPNVRVRYSPDNGETWTTITESTPNDGEFSFSPTPDQFSSSARLLVEPLGAIFFALSPAFGALPACDSVDFNNDGSLFDPQDVEAFLSVFSEGPCVPASATCNDIDFNNDGSLFDPDDIDAFLRVFSEGPCD